MLQAGDIDAFIGPRAPSSFVSSNKTLGWLFEDPTEEAIDYFRRTRIFPIMHLVGVRRSIVERQPWLPMALLKAFERSKRLALQNLADTSATKVALPFVEEQLRRAHSLMGEDFWPYESAGQPARAGSLRQAPSRAGNLFAGRRRGGAVSSGYPRESQDLKPSHRKIPDIMERHASPESLPSLGADVPDAEGWAVLPAHRDLYYGGAWHRPLGGNFFALVSPGTGQSLGHAADASADDVDAAVRSAHEAFSLWRDVPPLERAKSLRAFAAVVRANARELALLDAIDCGNPVRAMVADAEIAASQIDFFAGLVTEMKGSSIPMGPDRMNVTVREPLGVVARIIPFNHPFMFAAGKAAAPLAAGNTVVVKPPEQAPLSALRLAELVADVFPPGVFNVITGSGHETGAALVAHRSVAKVALIGSVAAGRPSCAAHPTRSSRYCSSWAARTR